MQSPNRILIDGPAWVGDMVMAQTLFQCLKQNDPLATLDVIAPSSTQALLARMPQVNRVWVSPFSHGELNLIQRYRFARQLRDQHYTQAIILRNSLKSALIPFWANIPRRTGWLGEMRYGWLDDSRKLDKQHYLLMIERFMALAFDKNASLPRPYPRPALQVSPENLSVLLDRWQLQPAQAPILVLCPGAEYGAAKRWPTGHFAQVAKAKLKQGWQVWLLGSQKDKAMTQTINVLNQGRCKDLAGKTTLVDVIDLLSLAQCVVTNDSGLMHIAAAVGCRIIAIYGSSSATFTPPLSGAAEQLSLKLACSPCYQRECPLGHLDCLKKLTPDRVLQSINETVAS